MSVRRPEFESSALFVVHGEVPLNHAVQLGKLLRYTDTVLMTTAELEEVMPTVGMPSPNSGTDHDGIADKNAHARERADWVRQLMAENHGQQPYMYDVHMVQPAGTEGE